MCSPTNAYNNTHCAAKLQKYPSHYLTNIVIVCCSVITYISAKVTQQMFIVRCCNQKRVVVQQVLQCYFKLPIEGTSPTPRGPTFLCVAMHMSLATAIEFTRSPLHGIPLHDCLTILIYTGTLCVSVCVCVCVSLGH